MAAKDLAAHVAQDTVQEITNEIDPPTAQENAALAAAANKAAGTAQEQAACLEAE